VTVDEGVAGTVVSVVDLTSSMAPTELAALDARISVLSGILDAVSRIDAVNQAVQGAPDRVGAVAALRAEPFGYSEAQAGAVVDLPLACQTAGASGRWAAEKSQLLMQRAALIERQAEATAFHWFG
jgi:DNA gyrase/topoisomerase IV subunit A